MSKRWALILASLGLIGTMFLLVPWLTRWWGPSRGTLAVFCIYWFGFCLPLGMFFQSPEQRRQVLSLAVPRARWVPWVVGLQALALVTAAYWLWPRPTPLAAIALAIPLAAINGFCEEFFWRGAFLAQADGSLRYQAWGVVLFTCWHVPLLWAEGVGYHGPYVVVGGALVVGVLWGVIAARTQRIGWTILSHGLTNAIVFVDLITVNFLTTS